MGKLDGKVALISGGARGMGASHARTFVSEGAKVVIGDVLEEEGRALAEELGDNARFLVHDVTSEAAWQEAVQLAVDSFGKLDILVNNAGVLAFASMADMTLEAFRRVIDINLIGEWLGMKYASAVMEKGSVIVNISSQNGLVGGTNLTAYSSSKFGVTGLTKSAALELGKLGIRVNSVHPSGVATPMLGRAEGDVDSGIGPMSTIPIPRMAYPEEVSKMVLFLACDDSSFCTGGQYLIDGGMTAGAGF